jgi:hypothetical protein
MLYFVRIARYTGDTRNSEIETLDGEPGFLEEGNYEASQTAVDVQADLVLFGELAEGDDIVHAAIWEVDRRTYELFRKRFALLRKCLVATHHDRVGVSAERIN